VSLALHLVATIPTISQQLMCLLGMVLSYIEVVLAIRLVMGSLSSQLVGNYLQSLLEV
jgi:hypothetical protein